MLATTPIVSYKSPIEFRKRNTTAALDAARFKYLPTDDRSNSTVMVFVGSPVNSRRIFERPKETWFEEEEEGVNSPQKDQEPFSHLVTLVYEEDQGEFSDLISLVKEGLEVHPPEMCEDGLNGTYFLRDKTGRMVAVFKPQDEEGNSENNPKRANNDDSPHLDDKGILDGEGAYREVAAYLLDKETGFAGVPRTTMITIVHPSFGKETNGLTKTKVGSLQQFVQNDGASWDIGFGAFPDHEVQKIAAFDLRIFNNDRHGGNMLMKMKEDGEYTLTPIDHGFSLPSTMNRAWFDWLTWPQVKKPILPEIKSYISNIDSSKDTKTLEKLKIRPECLRTMKISTMLLKKGSQLGFTLYDIGALVSRSVLEEPSELEIMYERALKEMGAVDGSIATISDEERLFEALESIMDEYFAKRKVLGAM